MRERPITRHTYSLRRAHAPTHAPTHAPAASGSWEPGVSLVPMTKRQLNIHADSAAQGVVAATKDMNLVTDDLEMMMSLPTDSATRVLIAYRRAGGTSAWPEFVHKLVMMRWNALFQRSSFRLRRRPAARAASSH